MEGESKEKEKVGEAITDDLLAAAARLHNIYEPQWNARADTLKTIVSLSSASIVLIVTFSSSLRAPNVGVFWRYLILFSFAMLVTSLIVALIALWIGMRVYEVQSSVFNIRREIKQSFIRSNSHEGFVDSLQKVQQPSLVRIVNSDRRANRLFQVSSTCFCLAIISLAIVGTRHLLF